jgi:chromosome segregation ATPase
MLRRERLARTKETQAMIKRILLAGGLATAAGLFFLGRDAASYVCTSIGRVKDSVRNSVPIEFELDRARRMIRNLVPDIRSNMQHIAQEEVEVQRLGRQITDSTVRLDRDRGEIMRLKSDLASNRTKFEYAGRRYSAGEVKTDLAQRFDRYKTNDATLASLKQMQQAREKSLEAARGKLDGMLATKRQLEVDVEHLQARLKMLETLETTSNYTFDDSQLSRAKQLLGDLRTRLDVAERLMQADVPVEGGIQLDAATPENILEELTEYFEPVDTQVANSK